MRITSFFPHAYVIRELIHLLLFHCCLTSFLGPSATFGIRIWHPLIYKAVSSLRKDMPGPVAKKRGRGRWKFSSWGSKWKIGKIHGQNIFQGEGGLKNQRGAQRPTWPSPWLRGRICPFLALGCSQ